MFKILLTLGAVIAIVACNLQLNIKYRDFVNGQEIFSELAARRIYNEFHSPYTEKSEYRFKIFAENLIEIRNHNMGKYTWQQGINDFADMTFDEFQEQRLMAPQQCSATNDLKIEESSSSIPDSYDWTSFGMVTPVKNQGSCGSCWSFSTTGSMEAHWNILAKGKNITFSQQQLMDCSSSFDNHGCNGGLPSHAFEYIRYTGGLQSDVTYPYKAKNQACNYKKEAAIGYARYGSFNITQGDEDQLAQRLFSAGPVSIAFQVITSFNRYVSGVYSVKNCGKTTKDVNHAVLLTGYGTENGMKFWSVKNSWGATWGTKGYFKIQRGVNMCAIAECNSYPLIDSESLKGLTSFA